MADINWTPAALHVLSDPNLDNIRLMDQWLALGSSASVQEMKAALDRIVGLPWIDTAPTDRAGGTLYAAASVLPRVGADKIASDCLMVPALLMFDGSRSSCGCGQDAGAPSGIYAPADGP